MSGIQIPLLDTREGASATPEQERQRKYIALTPLTVFCRKERFKKLEYAYSWRINFYINVFFACVSFSIILPSLWPYLQIVMRTFNESHAV